nr:luminal-binding protein 5 [Ipomoea batatas]GMC51411.1 luminal-binding protein 5 [Ipomoea batatas]
MPGTYSLETYGWMTINDKDKLADKLESDEKEKIETATKEALQWLQFSQILVLSTNTMEILSLEIQRHECYLLEAGNQIKGNYSVRSAYKCLTQHLAMEGFSNWAKVWGLRVASNFRYHAVRAPLDSTLPEVIACKEALSWMKLRGTMLGHLFLRLIAWQLRKVLRNL